MVGRSSTGMRGRRILIVGCGDLGSRHLQAVATLDDLDSVEVVDPRPQGLELGQQRLPQVNQRNSSTEYRWLSSLEEAGRNGDLCIVATQAQGRCQLVREIFQTLGYSYFLLEKIVGQSAAEIEALLDFCKANGIHVWVNFQTRAYPFHQRAKSILNTGDPIVFGVSGGNHGLATNGVHNADLFAFYDGSSCIQTAGSSVDRVLHPSKRGEAIFDLSGTVQGCTQNGSRFTLTYAPDHTNSEQISIATRQYRCIVDHIQRWAVESDATSGWEWREVPFEGEIMVSQMTRWFASDILTNARCELPTLEESMVAHRFILNELGPHFNRLMGRDSELCPVT